MPEEVVYWSRTGKVLHKRPKCRAFRRVLIREMAWIAQGDYSVVGLVKSYDMSGNSTLDHDYPPENLTPCRWCYLNGGPSKEEP